LTADDLADWLSRHHWARETTRSARTALRAFYGWAYDLGHLDDNPAVLLPRVRALPPNPRPASEDAYRDALARADPDETLMLRLAAELGLRRAEVAAVHSRDLDQDNAGGWWLTVRGKGERTRRLPLSHALAALLRDRQPGYVFPGKIGGHLSPDYVGVRVTALLPAGVTMHALRHRFATLAYALGRDVFTVQRLLGHASPATTQRYVQTSDATMRGLVDAVAGLDVRRPATQREEA
jgi:integrase